MIIRDISYQYDYPNKGMSVATFELTRDEALSEMGHMGKPYRSLTVGEYVFIDAYCTHICDEGDGMWSADFKFETVLKDPLEDFE